ncbi:unnamed protein product [Sphagnum jensenii]|uniref:Glucan endo-1,3-beta-D-glucosidase n=1 Tax=Sphagnum jensenii TaxID=128206 RepID=A0ABP0W7Q4_9BRYO
MILSYVQAGGGGSQRKEKKMGVERRVRSFCSKKEEAWNCGVLRGTLLFLSLFCMCCLPSSCDYAPEAHTIGINYGQVADNLPAPAVAVSLIKSLGIGRVRIYDSDAATLTALGNSGLQVTIGMGNDVIPSLAASAVAADQWILANVVAYLPGTNITVILVGNELLTDTTLTAVWTQLVPAMQNLQASLVNRGLSSTIKISTACEMNILSWSSPPSNGSFRADIAVPVITPMLQFLNDTGSYLYVNVYPYFGWVDDPGYIPLDYALFTRTTPFIQDGPYNYFYLLDAQLDALASAMERIGFDSVRLAIGECGWPTLGTIGANVSDAQTFNQNLVDYILSNPTEGTPRRPQVFIPTYIFALFNEDLKPGGVAEQNWGILYANGSQKYPLNLTADVPWESPAPLVSPPTSAPSSGFTAASRLPLSPGSPPISGLTPPSESPISSIPGGAEVCRATRSTLLLPFALSLLAATLFYFQQ